MTKFRGVNLTVSDVQKYAEQEITKVFPDWEKFVTQDARKSRAEIQKETRTAVASYNQFFSDNNLDAIEEVQRFIANLQVMNFTKILGNKLVVPTQTIMREFNQIRNIEVKKALKKGTTQQIEQSHKDFGILTSKLFIIYTNLKQISDALNINERKDLTFGSSPYAETDGRVNQRTIKELQVSKKQASKLAEDIRQIYIAALALGKMPIGNFTGDAIVDIENALELYFKELTEDQHLINKVTLVDTLTGKLEQKLVLEVQGKRSASERELGRLARNVYSGLPFQQKLAKIFEKQKDNFITFKGSNSIISELEKQMMENFLQRKSKLYKSSSTYKKPVNNKTKYTPSTRKRRLTTKQGVAKLSALVTGSKRQRPTGQRRLNILKENINRKLPDAVEANMGRPGLEYQSGRFANSVKLDNLIQGPKTVIGEYSYMENPYATFENSDRWPSGYNPRPLITKSIRELAQKALGNKFTLRKA